MAIDSINQYSTIACRKCSPDQIRISAMLKNSTNAGEVSATKSSDGKTASTRTFKFGVSKLSVDEDEMRQAGIKSYRILVKCRSDGQWNIVYEKETDLMQIR